MTSPTTGARSHHPSAPFWLDPDACTLLVAHLAAEVGIAPEDLTLDQLQGEWLDEQLSDLIDRAQGSDHRAIVLPLLRGHEVGILTYTHDDGLLVALRDDPLFYEKGAQIDGGWDEPAAYIPIREDGLDLDLADFAGILGLVVERANALFPVLAAALRVRFAATRFTHRASAPIDRKEQP